MNLDEENVATKLMDSSDHYKKHFKVIRLTGILLLITPFFIVFGMTIDIWNTSHSPKINFRDNGKNFTAESCDYRKWFPLSKTLYVGVCLSVGGSVYVEFRRFSEEQPRRSRLQLDSRQWLHFKRTLPFIDQNLRLAASRRDFSSLDIKRTSIYNISEKAT